MKENVAYFVIVRGPLGVGKSAVSSRLAEAIGGDAISIDRILDDQGIWESGTLSEFLSANAFAIGQARASLRAGRPVIFDGNFYWREQIDDLLTHLAHPHYVFTLRASLQVCVARDARRRVPHGAEAAREVFEKTTAFDSGIDIDAERPLESVLQEILSNLPRDV